MCEVRFGNKVMKWEKQRNVIRYGEEKCTQARIAIKIGMRSTSGEGFDYNKK